MGVATPDVEVAVVGGGVAGLAAALALEAAGRDVQLLESADGLGGVAVSERIRGYLVERGPNTFRATPGLTAFVRDHGLESALLRAAPASRTRWLFRNGELVAVPMGPVAFWRTPLLSGAGKRRLLREPFVARGDARGESVARFASRRLGPEVVQALVGPFLTGVYAGDEDALGAEAVFPSLVAMERDCGSIGAGLLRSGLARATGRGEPRGLPGSFSHRDGLGGLAAALAARLAHVPRLGARVEDVCREDAGWRVETASGGTLRARELVVATPAREAAVLLGGAVSSLREPLESIRYAPIATIAFGAAPADLKRVAEGFGFLVPREEKLPLLGCLFMSELFPGRAPAGRQLLHAMIGGTRQPDAVALADDALVERGLEGLDRTLGLRGQPELLCIQRWPRAVPNPGVDHPARVRAIRRAAAEARGLHLAGGFLDGVSFADALVSGVAAAAALARDPRD